MKKLTLIKIAKADIEAYFEKSPHKVFLKKDLGKIFNENRQFWRLTQSMTTEKFVAELLQITQLKKISLFAPNYDKTLIRYSWGDNPSIYEIALLIKPLLPRRRRNRSISTAFL